MSQARNYRNNTRPHAPLSETDLRKVVDAIFHVMRETGVKFDPDPWVLDTFSDGGCDVSSKGIVKFPTDLVRGSIDSAAKSVRMWNRPGTDFIEFSPRHSAFMANYLHQVVDTETGERRSCTREDLARYSRVVEALPDFDGVAGPFKIAENPDISGEIEGFAVMAAHTTKPVETSFGAPLCLQAAIEMAAAIRGGSERLREKPYFAVSITQLPLYYAKYHTDQIRMAVESGIPVGVGGGSIGGASTPITIAGNIVNCFATDFAALVLTQLLRKGAFCMVGFTVVFMDPTTGNLGAINESTLAEMVKYQIGEHFGLPIHNANAGLNMGKQFNQEAVLGAAVTMTAGIFSQPACCIYSGSLDATAAYSLHALLLCHELIGMARRFWRGIRVDDETLALDVTHKVGPGGDFLGEMHTAVHCRKEISKIRYFASKTFEAWEQEGRKDLEDIIDQDLQRILAAPKPEPLPASVQEQLDVIVRKYRSA
ncbi:MAG: trimethylamine methyltransferase family protein [bacterium]